MADTGTETPSITGVYGWNGSSSYPVSGSENSPDPKMNYGSWNGDWKGYLEYLAANGDQSALDKLLNYLMSESSSQTARDWTANREDTAYQRLVADLKAAGINPYAFATFGASPFSSSSSGHSYGGNNIASYSINKEKNEQNWLKIALQGALPVIGALIAALI